MTDHFELRIVTPNRLVLDERVREVTAPGTVGEFGVLPDHAAFLTSLEIGPVTFRGERDNRAVAVRGGFAEMSNNVMTVLAEAAAFPDEVDVARTEQELREATTRLAALAPIDEQYPLVDADRRWAQARLDITRKR